MVVLLTRRIERQRHVAAGCLGPIPNTEVKPFSPDGTARASVWESRTSPN
jgi:hypothetical protein